MPTSNASVKVVAADPMKGDLLVHFSNGTSVLYHSNFLYDVRDDDGNVALSNEAEEEDSDEVEDHVTP